VGLSVCEDAWLPGAPFDAYGGVAFVANINGSPFDVGKAHERTHVLRDRARETGAWIVYVNAVGGQDELVFDGGSIVMAPDGTITCWAARFDEDLLVITLEDAASHERARATWPEGPEEVYRALELGVGDYVRKNGFREVTLGLSGGIDSALVATLYGDMSGGYAPIKDVPKTLVYELCAWRNERARERGDTPPIPQDVIDKSPSAELRADQLDTDTLPSYDVLDPIIEAYVEDDL